MTEEQKRVALEAALTGIGVATGAQTPTEGAKRLLGLAVDLIPVEDLKEFLTEHDRIFADLSVDVAEQIKLDGSDKR